MEKARSVLKYGGGTILLVVASVFGLPLFGVGAGSCMGYQSVVMDRLRACPQAQQLLGDDIGPAYVGVSCGSAESEGSFGHANWSLPVRGSKARGSYRFAVERRGGPWTLVAGTLTAEGQTVDITSCTPGVASGGAVPQQALAGTVQAVMGSAPVPTGTSCQVSVSPVSSGSFNCRVQVFCGGQVLYGGGQSGFTRCSVAPDAAGAVAVVAQDTGNSPQDGDPALDLRTIAGQATVSDMGAQGMWAVTIQLTPAVPPAAPPPAGAPAPPAPTTP